MPTHPSPRSAHRINLEEIAGDSLFFRLGQLANRPATWPLWMALSIGIGCQVALAGLWLLATGSGIWVSALLAMLLFAAADLITLYALPVLGYSFGDIRPQFFVLLVPRLLIFALGGLLAVLIPPSLALALAVLINMGGSLLLAWAALEETASVGVTRLTLTTPKLAPGQTLRLLHLSDLHLERVGEREKQVLALSQEMAPDLILFTGDYLNVSNARDPVSHSQLRAYIKEFRSGIGLYGVLGTPLADHAAEKTLRQTPMQLIHNRLITVKTASGGQVTLTGLDCTHKPERDGPDAAVLTGKLDPEQYNILLYHSPEILDYVREDPVDLYLCGHTHGGQIRLPIYGALYTASSTGKRFEMGLYEEGHTLLYVSRGIGLEGMAAPRVRLFCRPEIILIEIQGEAP